MKGQWRRCVNKDHIEGWQYLQVQCTINVQKNEDVSSNDELSKALMYAGHHDDLSDALMVGQKFAMNVEEPRKDFYFLKCTKT